jgi:hypothetical protein
MLRRKQSHILHLGDMIDFTYAINSRLLVGFRYDGFERLVIPAAYGLNQHTGNLLVRGYQVGGGDATRSMPSWSIFRVDKVVDGRILDDHFTADPPGYKRNDGAMDVIYAQL